MGIRNPMVYSQRISDCEEPPTLREVARSAVRAAAAGAAAAPAAAARVAEDAPGVDAPGADARCRAMCHAERCGGGGWIMM